MVSMFKKNRSKIIIINRYMLLMVGKGIRGGMCQSTYRYAKVNNKCMKNPGKKNK